MEPSGDFLYQYCCYVLHNLFMTHSSPESSVEFCLSYGTHCFHHLASYGAGFTGGQVTVVAALQVDADLGSCLHLELVHCLPCLGDIQLVVVLAAHSYSLLFKFPERQVAFRSGELLFFP